VRDGGAQRGAAPDKRLPLAKSRVAPGGADGSLGPLPPLQRLGGKCLSRGGKACEEAAIQ